MPEIRKWIIASAAVALFAGIASAQVGGYPGGPGSTGGPFSCTVTNGGVTPTLRGEGYSEQIGDIVLVCSGGANLANGSTIPTATITVFLNTTVTSRLLSSTGNASEALLLIDEPGSNSAFGYGPSLPQIPCGTPDVGAGPGGCVEYVGASTQEGTGVGGVPVQTQPTSTTCVITTCSAGANVFQGITSGNQIIFNGIPVMPPATSGDYRLYRITNIRANANQIITNGVTPGNVTASVSINSSTSIFISNSTLTVAYVQTGLIPGGTGLRNSGNTGSSSGASLSQCSSTSLTNASGALGVLRFSENFATAFKVRGSATQNIPGVIYNSESGLTVPAVTGSGAIAGYADYGTRLKAVFSNVPSGVTLYVTTRDVQNDFNLGNTLPSAVEVTSETAADNGDSPPLAAQTTTYSAVTSQTIGLTAVSIANTGTGQAVWEIISANPAQIDTVNFGVYIAYTANPANNLPYPGYISVTLSYAPTASGGAFTSSTGARASSSLSVPRFSDTFDFESNVAGISACNIQTLSITGPATLPAGAVYSAYSGASIAATGGTGLYSWSATGLPSGLVIAPESGFIAGTPTTNTGNPYAVVVTVRDTNSVTASKNYSLTIHPELLVTGSSTLPGGVANAAYTTTLTATGGSGSYNWSATGLPTGLTIGTLTGVISGTPTTGSANSNLFSVQVHVADSSNASAFQTDSLVIYPPPSRPQSPVVTQQAEVLPATRSSTLQPLLFAYVTSTSGFDTEITISNTSQDTLGSTPESGACSLYFYGAGAPAQNPQSTPQIPAGGQFAFRLTQGGSGVPAIPNFNGYVIANCGFPLARGFSNILDGTLGFGQNAQLVTRPRSTSQPSDLLVPFVTNQNGYDTEIIIANTSLDPFGTTPASGACSFSFYGSNAPATQPVVTPAISAGAIYANRASQLAPGFQGYAIAQCSFSNAASVAFVSDSTTQEFVASETPQSLTLPRSTSSQPLLFSDVTNQNGYDAEITIVNSGSDPFGTQGAFGTCNLNFYGSNAPAQPITVYLSAGSVYTGLVSQMAPGFAGYIAASCFAQAQGWAYTALSAGNGSFLVDGDSDPAELVTLPRDTSASNLLFPAVSNWNGVDTNITISNTSADPFGSTAGSGTCTISYFGAMLSGGSLPSPQVSSAMPAGSQLSFTISQGNVAQGLAGAPGFRGYVIAACGFPMARGLATITGNPPGDTIQATFNAAPSVSAVSIVVDGLTYTAPQTFNWLAGSTHTLGAIAATSGGTQYVFSNWSNGGRLSQSITAPASSTAYTVNFQAAQYNSCDLRQTGSSTVADVQLIINEALGSAPVTYDLSGTGVANVVDVQIEINAALGLGCAGQ